MINSDKGLTVHGKAPPLDFSVSRAPNGFPSPAANRTTLYIISWREKGPIKFGVAIDPVHRLGQLQGANPLRLRIFAAWWLHSYEAAYAVETTCLKEVEVFALTGEWANINVSQARKVAKMVFKRLGFEPERWQPSEDQRETRTTQLDRERKAKERKRHKLAHESFQWLQGVTKR